MNEDEFLTKQGKWAHVVMGFALAAFGLFWAIAGMNVPSRGAFVSISPAVLPTWSGVILCLSGLALAVIYLRKPVSETAADEPLFDLAGQIRVWLVQIVLLAYVLTLESYHYALTTFLAMLAAMAVASEPLRWPLIAKAAAITVFMFVVFILWLGTPLPGSRYV